MVTILEDTGLGFLQKVDVNKSVIIVEHMILTSVQQIVENRPKHCMYSRSG